MGSGPGKFKQLRAKRDIMSAPESFGERSSVPRPIVIVDYDPKWPILYEEEKRRILEAVGHKVLAVEHIGSTAVPGLGAKPIIDIMAGVEHVADVDECVLLLQDIGYDVVTPQPETPDWYYCLGKSPTVSDTIYTS